MYLVTFPKRTLCTSSHKILGQVRSPEHGNGPRFRKYPNRAQISKLTFQINKTHLSNSLDKRYTMMPIPLLYLFWLKSYSQRNTSRELETNYGLYWPLLTLHQYGFYENCSFLDGLSNAVYHWSLRCLIFRTKCWLISPPPQKKKLNIS